MYRLHAANQLARLNADPLSEACMARAYARVRLDDSARGLVFDPENHKYYLGGRELRSVSSIVEEYAPFDALGIATRCSKNKRHEMYGKTPEEIIQIWDERAAQAAAAGTQVHEFCEACFTLKEGCLVDQIDEALRDRYADGQLEASNVKEEAAARWWDSLDLDRYVLVAKETRIVNPMLNYAGTFDLLLYDLNSHQYCLRDFKTNKDLFRWFGDMLRPPLSPIRAHDLGRYTLQQNLYRIQLENIGLPVSSMELVWLKDDGSYENVPVREYDTLIRFALGRNVKLDYNFDEQ